MAEQRNKVKNFAGSIIGNLALNPAPTTVSNAGEMREYTIEDGSSQASVLSYHDSSFSDASVSCDLDEKACVVNRLPHVAPALQQRGSLFSAMFRAQMNSSVCSMFAFNHLQQTRPSQE